MTTTATMMQLPMTAQARKVSFGHPCLWNNTKWLSHVHFSMILTLKRCVLHLVSDMPSIRTKDGVVAGGIWLVDSRPALR